MSSIYPTYSRFPIAFIRGKGVYLWDTEGKRHLDFTSGVAVNNLGHLHPRVKQRVAEQLEQIWHSSNLFEQPLQEAAAERLNRLSGMDAAFFCNSGAEANEGAIKLARRYAQKVLKKEAGEVVSFEGSFHGRTLATLTATGQEKVKEGFAPLPAGFTCVPYNDLPALEAAINEQTCAVMLEVIQAEGGVHLAGSDWLKGVRRLCDRHDLLLIVDEVQTGMGRTGAWFGFQHADLEPDVITLAKGMGSGFPVGAVLGKAKTMAAFTTGSHGSTFGGNPLAMAAVLATIEVMEQEAIPLQAARRGMFLQQCLEKRLAHMPQVRQIRGTGLLVGIQMSGEVAPLIEAAREEGLLLLSAGPQVLRLLPPLIISELQIEEAVEILARVIQQV